MFEGIRFKRWAIFSAAGLLAISLLPRDASASPADWSSSFLMQTTGGVVNPAMLVAFNPQPEPPLWTGETLSSIVGGELRQKVTEVSNPAVGLQNFQFLFGVASNAGPLRSITFPPDPINDFRIAFSVDAGGAPVDFTAIVDVQSSSGGMMSPGSAVAFNPQPEPPAFGFGGFETYGLDFGVTSLSDVTLTVRIEDANGNRLNLVAIPEPGSLSLCVVAAAGLGMLRRSCRRR
jgi:hypothetical protein